MWPRPLFGLSEIAFLVVIGFQSKSIHSIVLPLVHLVSIRPVMNSGNNARISVCVMEFLAGRKEMRREKKRNARFIFPSRAYIVLEQWDVGIHAKNTG